MRSSLSLVMLLPACAAEVDAGPWTSVGEVYRVTVRSDTALVIGRAVLDLDVVTVADDAPVEGADVTLDAAMPAHGHAVDPVTATPLDAGTYEADLYLPMAGGWELTVRVDGSEGDDAAVVDVEVR